LKDPEIATLEEELRRIFGTKVQICNKRGNKGKLVIEYYSLNDFDRILEVVRK
jgi:ParB family chromosome partitioning protein